MSDEKYEFLNEEVADEVVPDEVEAASPAETVVTPEAPAPVVPTTTEPREETHVPLAALKAEREKRQQYERELAMFRQQQQQPPEVPGFYEAPEQHIQAVLTQAQQAANARLFAAFEEDAREAHSDYDEVLGEVREYAQSNPHVLPQVFGSANPARAAYKLGLALRAQKEMADPKAYRAKVEAEIRAQIKAEAEAAEKARAAQLAAIPPDLSAARSSRDQEVVEDDSLDSILASRKR